MRDKLSLFVGFTAACGKQDGASTVPRADSGAMAELSWQLRHSRESVSSMRFHTVFANSSRCSANFSLVSTVPTRW